MPKLSATAGGIQIDDGTYDASLLSIELTDAAPNSPYQERWLKWLFHVYATEEGIEMTAASSTKFGPKAKARGWIEALLSRKLAPGEEIDTDTLSPKDCQVTIKKDPESGFARIVDVMAQRRRPPVRRPPVEDDGIPF